MRLDPKVNRAIRPATTGTACGSGFSHSAGCLICFHGTIFTPNKLFAVVGCSGDRETLMLAKGCGEPPLAERGLYCAGAGNTRTVADQIAPAASLSCTINGFRNLISTRLQPGVERAEVGKRFQPFPSIEDAPRLGQAVETALACS
jgi:hypothetical protein